MLFSPEFYFWFCILTPIYGQRGKSLKVLVFSNFPFLLANPSPAQLCRNLDIFQQACQTFGIRGTCQACQIFKLVNLPWQSSLKKLRKLLCLKS